MMICYQPNGLINLLIEDPAQNILDYYQSEGIDFILDDDPPENFFVDHYKVDEEELAQRPKNEPLSRGSITADDIDTYRISDLPIPCIVNVDDQPYEIDDGEFEFSTSMPGTYVIDINHWPYMPFRAEVTAQ